MQRIPCGFTLFGAAYFALSLSAAAAPQEIADTIYFGGPIVTMTRDGDRAQALAVRGDKIVAVGSRQEVMTLKGGSTRMVDLKGRALMPGFIDAHSHVVQQSLKFSVVNLDPAPIGDVKAIADVQRKLRARISEKKLAPGQWVFG